MWEAFDNPFPLAAACSFSSRHHGALQEGGKMGIELVTHTGGPCLACASLRPR